MKGGDVVAVAWFIFCGLLAVAWIGVLIWLVVTVIGWIGRN
ncbi:hypothetical protein GCM10029976_090430 [Kribbella albertanoniae]|nr:hypothetical protein [Kribbella albertanoniae]